jgi:DNA invertase Pin-like site-specific DNA recombinase
MATIGYARVSTDGQSHDDQIAALRAAGATKVYSEKISGARSDRPQMHKAISSLANGDTLVVTRLDRLARSTRDLLNILDMISTNGATFKSLKETWADTTNAYGKLMITILGGLAEFERHLIKDRTDTGRARAKANGVKFGPKLKLNPQQRQEAIRLRDAGEPQSAIARLLGVDQSTISRLQA